MFKDIIFDQNTKTHVFPFSKLNLFFNYFIFYVFLIFLQPTLYTEFNGCFFDISMRREIYQLQPLKPRCVTLTDEKFLKDLS